MNQGCQAPTTETIEIPGDIKLKSRTPELIDLMGALERMPDDEFADSAKIVSHLVYLLEPERRRKISEVSSLEKELQDYRDLLHSILEIAEE